MTLSYSNGFVKLYEGDARNLSFLPDGSVDCVVTSPPYWGLRDYKLEPLVWDAKDGCEHQMEQIIVPAADGTLTQEGNSALRAGHQGTVSATLKPTSSAFCQSCGAWRGSLGLEPTPALYVQHLVQIFREVWRVMKPRATLWLVLGDSYAGSWGNYHPTGKGGQRPKATERFQREAWGDKSFKPPMADAPGLKPKDLVGIPWRVAFALQADGWWLRSDIIWAKSNPMPESVTDRPTKSHEYIFLLTKAADYYWDQEAVREPLAESTLADGRNGTGRHTQGETEGTKYIEPGAPMPSWYRGKTFVNPSQGRNIRSVWSIATQPYAEAHFATFPEALVEKCVLAGTSEKGVCGACGKPWEREIEHTKMEWTKGTKRMHDDQKGRTRMGGTQEKPASTTTLGWRPSCTCDAPVQPALVLDPFSGSGTVALVAQKLGRRSVGVELNPEYIGLAKRRLEGVPLPMAL